MRERIYRGWRIEFDEIPSMWIASVYPPGAVLPIVPHVEAETFADTLGKAKDLIDVQLDADTQGRERS